MSTIPRGPCRRQAFTKVELVIVLFISVFLGGLLVGCLQKTRDTGSRYQCINNLKQIGYAVQAFESTFKRLPPLYGGSNNEGTVLNSIKFPNVWGSTHVFLLPYIEQDNLYKIIGGSGTSPVYDATTNGGPGNLLVVSTYFCYGDPSMSDGIVNGGTYGGTSYAANAQVFAPLADETINGGAMYTPGKTTFTDRGSTIAKIKDGSSSTIIFTHSYALCGSSTTGTIWGYGAGVNQPPSSINTFQPWSRASYLGQTYMTRAGQAPFQNVPNQKNCVVAVPATPHPDAMLIALADGSVRGVVPTISPDIWNKACLPNDGSELGPDW